MADLGKVHLDISVLLGRAQMPIHQLLRMGRGAVIELNSTENDEVIILANDIPVARGIVVVNGTRLSVEIEERMRRPQSLGEGKLVPADLLRDLGFGDAADDEDAPHADDEADPTFDARSPFDEFATSAPPA